MGRSSRTTLAATAAVCAVVILLTGGCADTVADQSRTATVVARPSQSPTTTRISVPTWNFTDRMPMHANLFMAWLKADGSCAVIGRRPPYSVVVWPRGWYGMQDTSGQITIYTHRDHIYATTGGQVGFSGGDQKPSKGSDPCLANYPTMTLAEAWSGS